MNKTCETYCVVLFLILVVLYERMCEYVDHLHEHFKSPTIIRNAHYIPPKVSQYFRILDSRPVTGHLPKICKTI